MFRKLNKILDRRPQVQLFAAIFLIVIGCGLLIAGFIVPPPGEIHNSVLIAFGEILTFAGAVFGMRYRYRYGANDYSKPSDNAPN